MKNRILCQVNVKCVCKEEHVEYVVVQIVTRISQVRIQIENDAKWLSVGEIDVCIISEEGEHVVVPQDE